MTNTEKWILAQRLIEELEQEGMRINSGEVKATSKHINAINGAISNLMTLVKSW